METYRFIPDSEDFIFIDIWEATSKAELIEYYFTIRCLPPIHFIKELTPKVIILCISCHGTSWRTRKKLLPKFVCNYCKKDFDIPRLATIYTPTGVINDLEKAIESHRYTLLEYIRRRLERLYSYELDELFAINNETQ